jgi:hypothetical protein
LADLFLEKILGRQDAQTANSGTTSGRGIARLHCWSAMIVVSDLYDDQTGAVKHPGYPD